MCQDAPCSGSGSPRACPHRQQPQGCRPAGPGSQENTSRVSPHPAFLAAALPPPSAGSPCGFSRDGVPAQCERLHGSFIHSTPCAGPIRAGLDLIISIQEPKYFSVTFILQLYFESPELFIFPSVSASVPCFAFIKRTWWMNVYLSPLLHNCAFLELKYFVALQNIVCFEREHGLFVSLLVRGSHGIEDDVCSRAWEQPRTCCFPGWVQLP